MAFYRIKTTPTIKKMKVEIRCGYAASESQNKPSAFVLLLCENLHDRINTQT